MQLSKNTKLMISYIFDRISSLETEIITVSFNELDDSDQPTDMSANMITFNQNDYQIEEIILNPSLVNDIHPDFVKGVDLFVNPNKRCFFQLSGEFAANKDFMLSTGLVSSGGQVLSPKIAAEQISGPKPISVDFDLQAYTEKSDS